MRAAFSGLLAFAVYLATVCPGVRFWDTAELTAAAWALGIPHPPGFPLYILMGRALVATGFASPALTMNIFSAVCAAGAVVFTLYIFRELENGAETAGGYFGAALMAFSGGLWMQAVRAEVYAPAILLITASFLMALRFRNTGKFRFLAAGLYFWGMGAVTHSALAAAAFIPIMVAGLGNGRWRAVSFKRLSVCALTVLIAFSAFIYLPVRGALDPLVKWGRPETFSGFWEMVSAREFAFSVNLGGTDILLDRLAIFWKLLHGNFPLYLLAVALFGVWRWRKNHFLPYLFILGSGISIIREELPHPNHLGYLLLVILTISLYAGSGFNGLTDWLKNQRKIPITNRGANVIAAGLSLTLIVPMLMVQFPRNNLHGSRWAERLGRDIIEPLPDSTLALFTDVSSHFICRYLQLVEGVRTDCDLVMMGALSGGSGSREWYRANLLKTGRISGLNNLPDAEIGIAGRLIEANHLARPVHCEYGEAFRPFCRCLEPQGLLYRAALPDDSIEGTQSGYDFPVKEEFGHDRGAALAYAARLYARSLYYNDIGLDDKAGQFLNQALILQGLGFGD